MNTNNLSRIFTNYIENFELINNPVNNENFKWIAAKKYRELMDEIFTADVEEVAGLLYQAKVASENLTDNFTSPFYGMVKFARSEPETVRGMFRNLHADDGGDLKIRQEKMGDFFRASDELMKRCHEEGFMYRQDFHAVSTYLALYESDDHYIFKSTEATHLAEVAEFYDDWGSGRMVNLDVYYHMCDLLTEEIRKCPELLETDESRFDRRFKGRPEEMIRDEKKHMLAFDIMYCAHAYGFYDGLTFRKYTTKEKRLYQEHQNKALQLLKENQEVIDRKRRMTEATERILAALPVGTVVRHKTYGSGTVTEIDEKRIMIRFKSGEIKTFGLAVALSNKLIAADVPGFDDLCSESAQLLKDASRIDAAIRRTEMALKPYEEYLP